MKVRPARAGLNVWNPETRRPLLAEGEEVPRSTYWVRRLLDGDCLEVAAEASSESAETVPQPETEEHGR